MHDGEPSATAMPEPVYAAVGFRDLGTILEFAPRSSAGARNEYGPG
jgi:hypothetical protein